MTKSKKNRDKRRELSEEIRGLDYAVTQITHEAAKEFLGKYIRVKYSKGKESLLVPKHKYYVSRNYEQEISGTTYIGVISAIVYVDGGVVWFNLVGNSISSNTFEFRMENNIGINVEVLKNQEKTDLYDVKVFETKEECVKEMMSIANERLNEKRITEILDEESKNAKDYYGSDEELVCCDTDELECCETDGLNCCGYDTIGIDTAEVGI